jgi:putative selenium metabolism protein SsnA
MSGLFLKNARLATLDPLWVGEENLRVQDGRIVARGAGLSPEDGDEIVDLSGHLVMPGLVCAHTHLYSALARGMPGPSEAPEDFVDILEKVWWRLDRGLSLHGVEVSAKVGALDALKCGTTTLIDHHASPSAISGSLDALSSGIRVAGQRAALCYEVTDRGGQTERDEGLAVHEAFFAAHKKNGHRAGLVGAHAPFTLSDESLGRCVHLAERHGVGIHIHVAEDIADERDSQTRHGRSLMDRLDGAGALRPGSIVAHGTHLDPQGLGLLKERGTWLVHNPRSNMNNQVGYADVEAFTDRVALGTDGIGADMFAESAFAFFKARDAGTSLGAETILGWLAGGHRLANEILGTRLGSLDVGAEADLMVLAYDPPTPLTSGNLAWHWVFAMNANLVRHVIIDGDFRLRDGGVVGIDEAEVMVQARKAALALWDAMANLPEDRLWNPED